MKSKKSEAIRLCLVAGARPNFMKVAAVIHAIEVYSQRGVGREISYRLVHTGQHYDKAMSGTFFEELHIPAPDVNLGCGGGTQAEQTAAILVAFERDLEAHPCDYVVVVGDVTSTMACTLVAKKMNTRVIHIEAGIRSYDMTMPEEINRMVTDALCDIYFTTTEWAGQNLEHCGVGPEKIYLVGNVMIDTLLANREHFVKPAIWDEIGLKERGYLVLTLHRPANVDEVSHLKAMMDEILRGSGELPIIFPMHPRTAKLFEQCGIVSPRLHCVPPMGYLEFNYLVERALGVITDSGGITEETTVMGVPCMTLRNNTERPETCSIGTNELIGTEPSAIVPALERLLSGKWKRGGIPALWDGGAATRIIDIISKL